MKPLTAQEIQALGRGAKHGSIAARAAAELRTRRAADTMTTAKLRSLESVRALVADQGGDHRAELEVLDEILAAHGVYPEPQEIHDPQHEVQPRSPRLRPGRGWPFGS